MSPLQPLPCASESPLQGVLSHVFCTSHITCHKTCMKGEIKIKWQGYTEFRALLVVHFLQGHVQDQMYSLRLRYQSTLNDNVGLFTVFCLPTGSLYRQRQQAKLIMSDRGDGSSPVLIVCRVIFRLWLSVLCDGLWRPLSCTRGCACSTCRMCV